MQRPLQRNFIAILALVTTALSTCGLAFAQENLAVSAGAAAGQPLAAIAPATEPARSSAALPQTAGGSQTLHLLVGRSLVINSPNRIRRVSLADPSIAEAVVVSPTEVVVNGKTPGGVSLIIWDEQELSQTFEVSVDIDILGLSQQIRAAFPAEQVQVDSSGNAVVLSGKVSSQAVADKILDVVKNSASKVTDLLDVPVPSTEEISLQVRFADVDKRATQQLGVNILRNFGSNMPMSLSTQQFAPPGIIENSSVTSNGNTTTTTTSGNLFTLSNLLNIAVFRPDIDLAVLIQALQQNNLVQILAEPNLITASGKQASFLAGGEFPYPVVQSVSGTTTGAVTIQFKEFGVRLNFTPTALPDGTIHLKVQPEVSSLDFADGVQISGFNVPALTTDRVDSEVDLKDGQSFAIAGLLDNRMTEEFEKIPFIGDIPILGKLFQSRLQQKEKNELMVIVTPHIVHPVAAGQSVPLPTFPKTFLPADEASPQKPSAK